MRAILYGRVSTEEQARTGFSLAQQAEALRAHCKSEGIEVVAEFEDRASGASLDRPGLDALRDVVSSGGIDLVLAQDRDRFSREPAHVYVLREELREHGTALHSLNDRGDDSPEGELTDGLFDQLAKYERAKTAERTRRGRTRKAQEGKIVGTGRPPYGYRYADDHYHVDPERMPYVREIFEMIADGHSIYAVAQHLRRKGTPSPRGADGRWGRTTIRNMILSDTYLGTFWWGKEKRTVTTVSVVENGVRTYKKKVKREVRPREEWTAIPVPDSGIPPETIARARENIQGNVRNPSRNSDRTWELSGGIGVCGYCGSRLGTHTSFNAGKTKYFYYVCPKRVSNRDNGTCPNTKHYRAETLELLVKDTLVDAFQEESWIDFVNNTCDRRVEDLRKAHRSDPAKTRERLDKQIDALATKLARVKDLYVDGDIDKEEYRERRALLQEDAARATDERSRLDDLDGEMERIEQLRAALLCVESPFSGHYAFITDDTFPVTASLDTLIENGLGYGSRSTAARRRMELYRGVGLRVTVGQDTQLSLSVAGAPVRETDRASGSIRSPTETP